MITSQPSAGHVGAWPGKSDAAGRTHSAVCHMLDVAAAAERLWPDSALAGESPLRRQAILFLIALHDLGKISDAFRAQIELGRPPPASCRHWELTACLLDLHADRIARLIGGTRVARDQLGRAVAGHHGRPPASDQQVALRRRAAIGPAAEAAAAEAIEALARIFAPMNLDGLSDEDGARLSWLVSGLTVEADWIGSNAAWFPFASVVDDLAAYWGEARRAAQIAIARAGLARSQVATVDPVTLVGAELRPMQAAVAAAELTDGPCLALIEDATGAGKTEAALLLAHRMIEAGKAGGLYFALPTMATADAMFARMRPLLGRVFEGEPSLALLHGKRLLSEGFREVRRNGISRGERPEDAGCAAWIADDRRLSLLAEIGVGTVDQALMGVLPTRFATLRLAALARRVLVVDEAHSFDPYMEEELCGLLFAQARFGGSAIVMTATLPRGTRARFARAFRRGLGLDPVHYRKPAPTLPLPDAYPALTLVGADVRGAAVAPVPATVRTVDVERLGDAGTALDLLAASAARGAACAWVRNAVDEAIGAVAALRARGVAADLLHARFALCDRQAIEAEVLQRYGKNRAARPGRVLVATQVVESSLDLDFDMMVSDLAPIGALIQRAGRLWRHMDLRPADGRPVPGPTLHLLAPDPATVASARWVHPVLGAGAWVYPQDVLWRTAEAVLRAGAIRAPDGLRALIEAVHDEDGDRPDLPDPLRTAEAETLGRSSAEAGAARAKLVRLNDGYGFAQNVFADEVFPTRLGEPQVTLVLARRDGTGLRWWAEDEDARRAEALSEVQLSWARYRRTSLPSLQARPEVVRLTGHWKDWQRATQAIAVVEEDGRIEASVRYQARFGLSMSQGADPLA